MDFFPISDTSERILAYDTTTASYVTSDIVPYTNEPATSAFGFVHTSLSTIAAQNRPGNFAFLFTHMIVNVNPGPSNPGYYLHGIDTNENKVSFGIFMDDVRRRPHLQGIIVNVILTTYNKYIFSFLCF